MWINGKKEKTSIAMPTVRHRRNVRNGAGLGQTLVKGRFDPFVVFN
jgi:hypothetical protein